MSWEDFWSCLFWGHHKTHPRSFTLPGRPPAPARPKPGQHKAPPATSGAAGGMRKRFSTGRDGATASYHPYLGPGSLPTSPGVPEQPRSVFPSPKPRQDPAEVGPNAHIARSLCLGRSYPDHKNLSSLPPYPNDGQDFRKLSAGSLLRRPR